MLNLVVLSGSGISAESGIQTFRGNGGLWEGHNVMEVASPSGWNNNPTMVLDFYNQRRRQLLEVEPNYAHLKLASLENSFNVNIITQNVDDLHERASSRKVLHLHGELLKSRSSFDESLVYDCVEDIQLDDCCELGYQLRPHIVWFGEAVPLLEFALELVTSADILLIIGTSMQVYPAASLHEYAPSHCRKFLIDPNSIGLSNENITIISDKATIGIDVFVKYLNHHKI